MTLTGNKGEWSELYALLRILSVGALRIEGSASYPVVAIMDRSESPCSEYRILSERIELLDENGLTVSSFTQTEAAEAADDILRCMTTATGVFSVPAANEFMTRHGICSLHSQRGGKTDIEVEVYDPRIGASLKLGFSIKSLIGSNPTLFNASGDSTNFIFEASGLSASDDTLQEINSIEGGRRYRDRISQIRLMGADLKYYDLAGGILALNLQVIDSLLPQIMAHMILDYYSGARRSIESLTQRLESSNPCGFDQSRGHRYYERKVKSFLRDAALGMTANSLWDGTLQASGGYIVVDANGELTCTHAYDMNTFEDYLFRSTALDGPSGTRHGYGSAYEHGGLVMIKLPLQVRFVA